MCPDNSDHDHDDDHDEDEEDSTPSMVHGHDEQLLLSYNLLQPWRGLYGEAKAPGRGRMRRTYKEEEEEG